MPTPREQAITLITRYYATFNSGDREAFLDLLDDRVEHGLNQGATEHGKEAFRKFLERMDRSYREQVRELQVFATDDGSRGAAEFFIEGVYVNTDEGLPKATGQTYYLRVGAFFDLCFGKVRRITNYYNLQDWLKQVGAD